MRNSDLCVDISASTPKSLVSCIPDSLGKCQLSVFVVYCFLFLSNNKKQKSTNNYETRRDLVLSNFCCKLPDKLFTIRQTVFLKKSIIKKAENVPIQSGDALKFRLRCPQPSAHDKRVMKIHLPMRVFLFSYKDNNIPHFT